MEVWRLRKPKRGFASRGGIRTHSLFRFRTAGPLPNTVEPTRCWLIGGEVVIVGTQGHGYMVPAERYPKRVFGWKGWGEVGDAAGWGLARTRDQAKCTRVKATPRRDWMVSLCVVVILWFGITSVRSIIPSQYLGEPGHSYS
jgi:hypothetical protein